ncbi:hypothetical protein PoB_004859700 [Plakobranchus ocellatus]|uniref:Uncharacterized protein n=1 Tax=Plakobranchus ocellatus TaxID=259542 RepID=A0AAV4BRW9_9GAST|nr:hypothetical protein PoB_004859700 [Plakobranchus ocellatus]
MRVLAVCSGSELALLIRRSLKAIRPGAQAPYEDWGWFLCIDSPQQGDLRLSGPPVGRSAGGGARTRDRSVAADLSADSLATNAPPPLSSHTHTLKNKCESPTGLKSRLCVCIAIFRMTSQFLTQTNSS